VSEQCGPAEVVNLDRRRRLRERRRTLAAAVELSRTGAHPFKGVMSDGSVFWCKQPSNPHGIEEVVNEVVAAVVSAAVGAPCREWAIVDVPAELVSTSVPGSTVRLQPGPYFGSAAVHTAVESDELTYVDRDDNYERIPRLIAAWLLCNAEDIQMMYDLEDSFSIWSLDHGFWFGSHERPWSLARPDQLQGRPELPGLDAVIPLPHWERAVEAVNALTREQLDDVHALLPPEWNVPARTADQLLDYVVSRRNYAVQELDRLAATGRTGRRR